MYLKRGRGPAVVTLPNGQVMSRSALQDPDTKRWVATRKAAVARGVLYGLMSVEDACTTYGLSSEELASWTRAVEVHGDAALRATRLRLYRPAGGS